MNADRFSLSRFSLRGEAGETVRVDGSFYENLKSVAGSIVYSHIIPVSFVGALNGFGRGAIAIPAKFSLEENLTAGVSGNANVVLVQTIGSTLMAGSSGSKNVRVLVPLYSVFDANVSVGKNIPHSSLHTAIYQSESFASKNVMETILFAEVATTITDAGKLASARTTLQVDIPPGGELRIDASTFQVLLNGENVLWAQEGDWPYLSRETLYLDVESASGGKLDGIVIYQERFL